MTEYTFTIPADYGCLAILDPENYSAFVSEDWAVDGLKQHFIDQNEYGSLISWGCGYGNWIVKLIIGPSTESGFQSFVSGFKTGGQIVLTTYESLAMAAQFEDVSLPEAHEQKQLIHVEAGNYQVKVIQLFPNEEAESEEVFSQQTPHYLVALEPTNEEISAVKDVPWFEGY